MRKTKLYPSLIKLSLIIGLLFVSRLVFADESLGGISENVLGPINILRHLFNIASIVLGIFLLLSAFNRYVRYRQNPQESPLSTVITWALLGVLLIVIPIAYHLSQEATEAANASSTSQVSYDDIND